MNMMTMNNRSINTQKAFEYILYMIIGSYFNTACALNMTKEKNLFLYYCDLDTIRQYEMEERCIHYVEQELMKDLPLELWNREAKVKFYEQYKLAEKRRNESKQMEVQLDTWVKFITKDYVLIIKGIYLGDNTRIIYELQKRERIVMDAAA